MFNVTIRGIQKKQKSTLSKIDKEYTILNLMGSSRTVRRHWWIKTGL